MDINEYNLPKVSNVHIKAAIFVLHQIWRSCFFLHHLNTKCQGNEFIRNTCKQKIYSNIQIPRKRM